MTIGDAIALSIISVCVAGFFVLRQWRAWFCEHDWERLGETAYYAEGEDGGKSSLPVYRLAQYRCKKCGCSKTYKR